MKVHIHKSTDRGFADYGWVKSWHSFSFACYFNPLREKFGVIRVLNDEMMEPGGRSEMHEHKNIEVIILPLKGELEQEDSRGNKTIIKEDEVLIISAGSGLHHSLSNRSENENTEILQIWLFPKVKNTEPRIQVLQFPAIERRDKHQRIVSPSLISDILWINQDAWISRIDLKKNNTLEYSLMKQDNYVLVFVLEGSVILSDNTRSGQDNYVALRRDSIELKEITQNFIISAQTDCSLLIIDAPPD